MKKFLTIFLAAACFTSFSQAVTKNKSISENNFSKGVDTYHNSQSLPEGYAQDSLNVLYDGQAPVQKRQGYTVAWSTKSYQYTGLWTYTDSTNTTWMIARSSDQITATNLAGSVVKVATVSVNNVVGETNAFGYAFFVDQTQGVYYWNGSTTTYEAGSPLGSIINTFHSRLWVTGLAVPNGNQIYGSTYNDGTSANAWNTAQAGLPVTEAVLYFVGLNDNFDNITAEYVYLDTQYIFKHSSIFALYGFDQSSFQISQLTQECGCIDGNTIQTWNSALEFVSLRGVEAFNGYTCTRISDAIKNKVDPAIQLGGFSQQSWVQSSLIDWASGSFSANNNISTTSTVSPAMQWVGAGADIQSSDFGLGVLTGLSYNSGGLQITTDSANVNNYSFENGTTGWTFPTFYGSQTVISQFPIGGDHCFATGPRDGSNALGYSGSGHFVADFRIQKCSDGSLIGHTTVTQNYPGSCAWVQQTIPETSTRTCAYITVQDTTNSNTIMTSGKFLTNGNPMTFWTVSDYNTSGSNGVIGVDFYQGGRTDNENDFQISRVFNTYKTSSTVVPKIPWVIIGSTPSFVLQTSTDSSSWFDVGYSTGVSYHVNQYVRYLSTWTFSPNLDLASYWPSVDLQPLIFISTWTSACHAVGSIGSWGNLSVTQDLSGGVSTAFTVCGSANSNCTPSSCSVIPVNSQITISTKAYVQIISTFTATVTTQTATINSITAQWFTGSVQVPMASTIWDNRYWLSLTTTTSDSANDAVMVLNKNGAWAPLSIHAGAFTQYKNSLYHADSNPTGNIYLDNQGEGDNGQPINAYVHTRTYGLGDFASDDYFYAMYPFALNTGNCSMTVQYQADKTGVLYSLGSPLLNEYSSMSAVRLPFPIDSTHQDFGQSFDFILGTNDSQCDFQLYGYDLLFKSRPIQ